MGRTRTDHGPGERRRHAGLAGLAVWALVVFASGCHTMNPRSYETLEDWFIGRPARDYDLYDGEDTVQGWRMTYGFFLGFPYGLRDGARILALPLVYPYYLNEKGIHQEHPTEKPLSGGSKARVQVLADLHDPRNFE